MSGPQFASYEEFFTFYLGEHSDPLTLNPVFQFDGYWFLVDYLGLPDLRGLAWGQLKRWILRSKDIPALPPMRRDGRLVFLVYVAGSAGFVALLLRMEYRYLLRPAALFVTALPKLFDILVGALKAHEFLKFGNSVLALLYVFSVPLSAFIGLGAYAIRIYRYFARRNRPILRRFSGD